MTRIRLAGIAVAGLLAATAFDGAVAQEAKYAEVEVPATVQVIVSSQAGGSTDALARVAVPYWERALEELTGQDVATVIKNIPGAGTEIGATALASAEPDGSTIGIINLPHIPLIQASRDAKFEPWLENFVPLAVNVVDPNVLILGENAPYETIGEAVNAAKSEPGSVVVGAQGPLSDDQLALYALQEATGAKFTFLPFDGGAGANRALRGGEIDLTIGNVFDYVQLKDAAKDAAVFSPERYGLIEDVPTIEETVGVAPGELASTRGFAAPDGLPDELLELYREAFRVAFENPEFIADAKKRNITLVEPRIGEAFGKVLREQQDLVAKLLTYFEEGGYLN